MDGGSDDNILDPIASNVLQQSKDLATLYRDARPYPHGIIPYFCKDGFLGEYHEYLSCSCACYIQNLTSFYPIVTSYAEEILEELKHNTKVKFKETDLFRVFQSIDLVSYSKYDHHLFMQFYPPLSEPRIDNTLPGKLTRRF